LEEGFVANPSWISKPYLSSPGQDSNYGKTIFERTQKMERARKMLFSKSVTVLPKKERDKQALVACNKARAEFLATIPRQSHSCTKQQQRRDARS
jgi:hypothetical protein